MEWWRSVFEAIVGPLVVATLISTMGLGFAAWGRLVELEFELARHTDKYAVLLDRHERLRADYYEFKGRGGRYSATDGERDRKSTDAAISALQTRLESLAQRCDGCWIRVERLEVEMKHLDEHQQ